MSEKDRRADIALVRRGFARSRTEAQAAIRAGRVHAGGKTVRKPSEPLAEGVPVAYSPAHPYVSRGALKLAAALGRFDLSPAGRVCLDVGSSTGGFTQLLLERGARRVYAADVGQGQLHAALEGDPRIVRLEGVDARNITRALVPETVEAVTADLSFISLAKAMGPALALAAPGAWAVLLVKPQFEAGRAAIGKGGVVRAAAAREAARDSIAAWVAMQSGWSVAGTVESPIAGGDGNIEYLLVAQKAGA